MDASALLNVMLALGVTIALVFVCGWLARRFLASGGRAVGAIQVIASMPLGNREKLIVVEVAGEQRLIGVTAQQISDLGCVELAPAPVAATESRGFKAALGQVLGDRARPNMGERQ